MHMRLLITGASGLLGLNVALDACRAHEVTGVDRHTLSSPPFGVIRADLLEPGAVDRVLEQSKPDAVIHCAALADVDLCERKPDLARMTNAEIPARLAEACLRRRIQLVHISTDAVFDGAKAGYYAESDPPHPMGVYALTKFEGEQAVLSTNPLAIVARVNFYGWSLSGKRSLAEFFVDNLTQGNVVSGFTDVTFCPMLANHLGVILLAMIRAHSHGLFHVVGPEAMTKYQFGVEIARQFGLDERQIQPLSVDRSNLSARRSHNLCLSTYKLSTELGLALPEFSTGLAQFHEQYRQGYPQKLRSYQQVSAKQTQARKPTEGR